MTCEDAQKFMESLKSLRQNYHVILFSVGYNRASSIVRARESKEINVISAESHQLGFREFYSGREGHGTVRFPKAVLC